MTVTIPHEDGVARLYRATRQPEIVQVPALTYLCVDGHGDPETSASYTAAVKALYSLSYAVKFAARKAGGPTFKVSPLEGLWWAEEPESFTLGRRADWSWTMMIRQPEVVTGDFLDRVARDLASRLERPPGTRPRLVSLEEGTAAQVLHVGPYADEGPTVALLHAFIRARGFGFAGPRCRHHEIYLRDPRRSPPDKLRTIIRQPFETAGG